MGRISNKTLAFYKSSKLLDVPIESVHTWSSSVGDISNGKIWLKSGPAPNSLDLSVICLNALYTTTNSRIHTKTVRNVCPYLSHRWGAIFYLQQEFHDLPLFQFLCTQLCLIDINLTPTTITPWHFCLNQSHGDVTIQTINHMATRDEWKDQSSNYKYYRPRGRVSCARVYWKWVGVVNNTSVLLSVPTLPVEVPQLANE